MPLFFFSFCPARAAVNWSQRTLNYPLSTVQRRILDILAVPKASSKMPLKATVKRVPRRNSKPTHDVDLTIMLAEIKKEIRKWKKATRTTPQPQAPRVDRPKILQRTARMRVDPRWWGRQIAQPNSWRVDACWWAETRTVHGSFCPWAKP
jgi:hypothetical protein